MTLPEFYPRLSKVAEAMGIPHVLVVGEGSNTISSWIDEGAEGLPQPLPKADDYAMMFFTGGTTGLPKGAEHRHHHIMAFCRLEAAFFSTLGYDREVSLSVAPMFHIFGHHHGVIHPLYIGSTHVLVRQYKPDIVLAQLSKYKVTLFAGGPVDGVRRAAGRRRHEDSGSFQSEDLLRRRVGLFGRPAEQLAENDRLRDLRRYRHVGRRAVREQSGDGQAQGSFGRRAAAGNGCGDRGSRNGNARDALLRARRNPRARAADDLELSQPPGGNSPHDSRRLALHRAISATSTTKAICSSSTGRKS